MNPRRKPAPWRPAKIRWSRPWRPAIQSALAALSLALFPGVAAKADAVLVTHGLAIHGEARYPPGFPYLDYVNPDAPKGGELKLARRGTFDSFNPWIPKGNAAEVSAVETLAVPTLDEPNTKYGLIAESMEVPPDRSWVIFNLREEARWHDGQPITASDVRWSFDQLKQHGRPFYRYYYGNVTEAEVLGPRRIRFRFNERNNRELPVIMGQLPVLPEHYWKDRDFTRTTLEPPLGSGPYRVTDFEPGRFVVVERVEDYWARDLPIRKGQFNFERIRYDYYLDPTVIRQALKAGEFDFHRENIAKVWALDYDIPAVRNGWLKKEVVPDEIPAGMQAFVMNTRREVFKDRRVREAIGLAFDFEWTNRKMFFGQYTRTTSFFENSDLASSGVPQGEELRILEPFRDQLRPEVFDVPFAAPQTDGSGWPRANLRRAFELMAAAGWEVRDFRQVDPQTGKPFRFEILLASPSFERIVLPFARNLDRLGIEVDVRLVDRSQYINRLREFDYDMMVAGWGQSESPGNEQRNMWTTKAAGSPGARNYAGIQNPVIDQLVEQLIVAPDRESLVAHTQALDRVLLWNHYVVPNWFFRGDRILYWNKFSRPAVTPKYGTTTDLWWWDKEKAEALAAERGKSGS